MNRISKKIAVIDYGAGNLGSMVNALNRLGYRPSITGSIAEILRAEAVFLPGVGAAGDTMQRLNAAGLSNAIRKLVKQHKPLFAVCVGLQVLLSSTEEGGEHDCLNIIPGRVIKLPAGLKVPHMGWNQVRQQTAHPIFDNIPDNTNFYFVHSYYAQPLERSVIAGVTDYGMKFCSMIISDSMFASQFHPEKSGEPGLTMYSNFLRIALQ